MTNPCIFCQIVAHETPSYVVLDDSDFLAFLDLRPLFPGHCLLVPKKHIETIYDLPKPMMTPYLTHLQRLGQAIEKSQQAKGTFIAINNKVSQSVPHLHTHIVPRNPKDGLKGFFWPRTRYQDQDHMKRIQDEIKLALLNC